MRKQQKSKTKAIPKEVTARPVSPTEQKKEPENTFDFGGLPNRDLKKNLGCG